METLRLLQRNRAEIARKKKIKEVKEESISIYRGPSFFKKSIIIPPGKEMVYSACNV